ncbi:Disease resistance protein RPS6 [Linum perenne]
MVDMDCKAYNPLEEYRTTEGISLDLTEAKEMYLEANAFDRMNSLTFLKIWEKRKIHVPYGGLDSLPNGLRWLEWDLYPSKFLPSKFYPQHLVHLNIRHSPIQSCWRGYDQPQLVNLIVLNLYACENLITIPNISSSSNLEELVLSGCTSLVEVPSYVQYFTKLITIDFSYCPNLKHLPPKLDSKLLKHVRMSYLNVTHCPEINSRELEELNLDKTSLLELPSAVYNVKQNGDLYLYGKNIINFPAITRLRTLLLKHTSIRETDFSDDDDHQTSSVLAQSRFRALYLHENSQLESMPNSIQKLSSLTKLIMVGCESIRSLPELPPNVCTLELSGCKSLQALPSNTGNLMKLGILQFENCPQLDQTIPIEIVTNFFVHGEFQQSRSELPKWFSHRSMNLNEAEECIVRMELPLLKDGDQSMIKGIVFGAVYSSHYNGYVTCGCEVGNTIVAAWISSLWDRDVSESDKLWLMFSKKLPGNCAMGIDENEAWYVKFAGLVVSFKFYIEEPGGGKFIKKKLKVKGCGVSFLY